MDEIKKLTVIGAGTMGNGIVQAVAQSGINVVAVDLSEELIQKGMNNIKKNLNIRKERGEITEKQETEILSNISVSTDLCEAAGQADMVIEAVPEKLELKQKIFGKIDEACGPNAYLVSCTSGISITAIAAATCRRDKVIGIHFTNPVPRTKGAAIIEGLETSERTIEVASGLLKRMGKEYWITKDFPGFSGTRIMGSYINEAFRVLQEGVASAEDIDKEMKMVLGHPMGPLELADFAGLDVILASLEYLHAEKGDLYCPSPLLKQLVAAGYCGKKTGRGVYSYK